MDLSPRVKSRIAEIGDAKAKLGEIKRHGKEIKKDHDLALELWSTGNHHARLLATLSLTKQGVRFYEMFSRFIPPING